MLEVDSEKRIDIKGLGEHEWTKGEVYGDKQMKEVCEEMLRKGREEN